MTPDAHTIHKHMLAVGDGHELYIQEWGQRSARRTFLFLHEAEQVFLFWQLQEVNAINASTKKT